MIEPMSGKRTITTSQITLSLVEVKLRLAQSIMAQIQSRVGSKNTKAVMMISVIPKAAM